jgi:hypothetical protein
MQKLWKCEGCGHEQRLRRIDTHRWVTTSIDLSGVRMCAARMFELCPSCQFRLMALEGPEILMRANERVTGRGGE